MISDLPTPDHARNMRLIGYSDRAAGRTACRSWSSAASPISATCSPRASASSTCAIRARRSRTPTSRRRRHLEHPSPGPRRSAARDQRQGHVRRSGLRGRARLLSQPGRHRRRHRATQTRGGNVRGARLDRGPRGLRHPTPGSPRRIGFMPVGRRHSSCLVHGGRWAYVLALIDGFTDYIFVTVDMAESDASARGRALLAARHEPGGR